LGGKGRNRREERGRKGRKRGGERRKGKEKVEPQTKSCRAFSSGLSLAEGISDANCMLLGCVQ